MQKQTNRDIVVAALKHAAPYVRMYKKKVFVLKAGGEIFATKAATRAFVEFVQGRRVTDEHALEVAAMVLNGEINTRILAACRDLELPAVGISGVDAGLIRAHKRPPVKVEGHGNAPVDYGFVGDIESVDAEVLRMQLDSGLMPVISPLSADHAGTLLNINADTVAAALAAALGAEKLILVTSAPGILQDRNDASSVLSYIDLAGLRQLREDGALADGMLPKAAAIETAIRGGVARVHIISYKLPESLLLEVFTNEGTGTLVVANVNTLSPAEQAPGNA
jgi:acetylglutamate kinase